MKIENYPGYILEKNGTVINPKGKEITPTIKKTSFVYKMKDCDSKWKSVSEVKVHALAGNILKVPDTARRVYGAIADYFIDVNGDVYSFNINQPKGIKLAKYITSDGYPTVTIDGKKRSVHTLLAKTFIMPDYVEKGLCCMHGDDNKLNCNLNNISIGTYSQNNKDAYDRGCQPRRYNKKEYNGR